MDQDVYATQAVADRISDCGASFGRGDVGGNKVLGTRKASWTRPGRGQNDRAGITERGDHGLPHPLGAAGHERSLFFELEISAHDGISSAAILPPSSVKTKSSVIGLPGNSPVSWVLTTVLPSRAATATGSTVCPYFFAVSSLQAWIALRPRMVWPSSLTVASAAKQSQAVRGHECFRAT